MPEAEQVIFRFFNKEDNVNKLVEFLSLENKKGHDHFDAERFGMFKALFRNFGDSFLPSIRAHIEKLVCDHRESHQRAASELLAAIIRGSKHWPYSKVEPLWGWVVPAIRQALTKVSPETQRDWGTCFATSSDSRDPNRLHWLMEVAMEEPIRSQGSFIDASRLYMMAMRLVIIFT
jgi:proteasome activator subunit 4